VNDEQPKPEYTIHWDPCRVGGAASVTLFVSAAEINRLDRRGFRALLAAALQEIGDRVMAVWEQRHP
jgi:hypothetical protein